MSFLLVSVFHTFTDQCTCEEWTITIPFSIWGSWDLKYVWGTAGARIWIQEPWRDSLQNPRWGVGLGRLNSWQKKDSRLPVLDLIKGMNMSFINVKWWWIKKFETLLFQKLPCPFLDQDVPGIRQGCLWHGSQASVCIKTFPRMFVSNADSWSSGESIWFKDWDRAQESAF